MSLKTPSQIRAERMRIARRIIRTGNPDPPKSPLTNLSVAELIERLSTAKKPREIRRITREIATRIL